MDWFDIPFDKVVQSFLTNSSKIAVDVGRMADSGEQLTIIFGLALGTSYFLLLCKLYTLWLAKRAEEDE